MAKMEKFWMEKWKKFGMEMVQFGLIFSPVPLNFWLEKFHPTEDLSEKLRTEEVDLTEVRGCVVKHLWLIMGGPWTGGSLNDLFWGDQRSSKVIYLAVLAKLFSTFWG